jgi:hypothetical protein
VKHTPPHGYEAHGGEGLGRSEIKNLSGRDFEYQNEGDDAAYEVSRQNDVDLL